MVIHGGIDGYSRAITYLCCNSNNKSSTVLSAFNNAVDTYGLPTKVRSDHGGENIEVWRKMMAEHGTDQCIIVGSSTHNERIERLWRDVHRSVVVVYANLFRELEEGGNLDSLNEVDVYCLHYVFIPKVNNSLKSFMDGWNNHAMSSENNRTPYQMFVEGIIPQITENADMSEDEYESSAETEDPPESQEAVSVPRCNFQPCDLIRQELQQSIDPSSPSDNHGQSLYLHAISILGEHLRSGCDSCMITE